MRFLSVALLAIAFALAACTGPSGEAGGDAPAAEAATAAPPPMPEGATDECVLTPPEEPVHCTMEYVPVCGCDGKSYGNACAARAAGVPRFTAGACDERLD